MFIIVLITKAEKDYLVAHGVKFGYAGISHTDSRHRRTYYMCENDDNKKLLSEYRKERIVK